MLVELSAPLFGSLSPVSSTFSVSAPSLPFTVSRALTALTLPDVSSPAVLPTLIVSSSAPVFTVSAAAIACTFTVSMPAPVFTNVVPALPRTLTVSAPPLVFSVVVMPARVDTTSNVSPPEPRLTFSVSSVP